MDVTERISLLVEHWREAQYSQTLLNAIQLYLSGQGSLAQIQQAWQAQPQTPAFPPGFSALFNGLVGNLDELGQRCLDICAATNHLNAVLQNLDDETPIEPLYHYFQQQGQQQMVLGYLLESYGWMREGKPAPLGRLLLCYLPEYLLGMLRLMKQRPWRIQHAQVLELLLAAQPPYTDLAWQIVQQVGPGHLGFCAAPLLKADPARFREWAQQIASPGGPGNETDQLMALLALFEHDFANNIDLALTIISGSRAFSNRWDGGRAQQSALEAVYRFDPARYLYLLEDAILSKDYHLYTTAQRLLASADPEQARLILERAVSAGPVWTAAWAAKQMLNAAWDERQAYALSLLEHRAKQVRDVAIDWLLPQGEALVEQVSPLLAHKSAYARLAAVEILTRLHLSEERTRSLLAARRDIEKTPSVKQAIVDAIGLAEPPADLDPATAITALVAEAAAAARASPLAWFQPQEPTGARWVNGDPVSPAVITYLLISQARIRQMQLAINVRRVLRWLDRQTTGTLALTLFTGWTKQGGGTKESWSLPLAAALGDDRLVQPLRRQIDAWGRRSKRRVVSAKVVQALALIGSDLALTEVGDLARHAKSWHTQQAAQAAFADAASLQNLAQEELADRIAPRLGFNEQGEHILDFGPRQFTARLHLDLSVHLKDSNGKRLTLLPRPNARDDAAKVAAAQAAWLVLKKHAAPAAKLQTERLENALDTRRAWSVDRWRELFLQHPLLRALAVNLVWGVLQPGETVYQMVFRPLEDGSLTNADDDACALPAEGQIRLVHPAELDEAARSAWLQHLADYEVMPPFPQLNRSTIPPDDTRREGREGEER